MTNWYTWKSQTDFDTWHATVITGLNLPRVGANARSGMLQPNKQQTTAYTSVTQVADDDWRATVEPSIAEAYEDGLGALSEAPPIDEGEEL